MVETSINPWTKSDFVVDFIVSPRYGTFTFSLILSLFLKDLTNFSFISRNRGNANHVSFL